MNSSSFCMLYRLYAISCQLSPVEHSSGVEHLETDTFKLHCLQTQTGLRECLLYFLHALYQEPMLSMVVDNEYCSTAAKEIRRWRVFDLIWPGPVYLLECTERSLLFTIFTGRGSRGTQGSESSTVCSRGDQHVNGSGGCTGWGNPGRSLEMYQDSPAGSSQRNNWMC